MMEGVTQGGTASRLGAYNIPFNIIGKTGTTQNNGDGWFIGASPELVVGAWVGTFDKRVQFSSTTMGSGANTALPIVASVFRDLSYWRRPILTNFEYEMDHFPCWPYSMLTAEEAYPLALSDPTYRQYLSIRDSIRGAIVPIMEIENDSLAPLQQQLDSIAIDSSAQVLKKPVSLSQE